MHKFEKINYMCFAKIYTNNKNFKTLPLIDVLDFSEYVEDNITPTLLIGKKNSEDLVGKENIKVLNRRIENNLYWTYSKVEKRSEYEKDIEEFYNRLFKVVIKSVKYINIDLYNTTYNEVKKVISILNNEKGNYIYLTNNHLYVYDNNNVYGISLCEVEYLGINKEKIINKIKENKKNIIIYNDFFIENSFKKYLNGNKIVIPYIYYLKNQHFFK